MQSAKCRGASIDGSKARKSAALSWAVAYTEERTSKGERTRKPVEPSGKSTVLIFCDTNRYKFSSGDSPVPCAEMIFAYLASNSVLGLASLNVTSKPFSFNARRGHHENVVTMTSGSDDSGSVNFEELTALPAVNFHL